ncbi:catalase [Oceanobacillus profundus]|uniref:catalase n=1 Tax=Oceanobacillus profundus TaxID=372463 RepID=A0A417YBC8_9BACI|nr:catalase [Oceanobacillus profundus]RHW30008.1 catalase [Oceanobacillus profundus]
MDDEKSSKNQKRVNQDFKQEQLEQYRMSDYGQPMTTQEGKKRSQDQDQLKAGIRGPSLRQDYELLEKVSHFVHEEIPERVVHARCCG